VNVEKIRRDFPILNTGIIYFDNAASSLTPEPVLAKMLGFYREYRANVERGVHRLSQRASEEYEKARSKVANFINAKTAEEIIITKNTTEGIKLVANGLNWEKDDKIVTSNMEHHSNFLVWLHLWEQHGIKIEVVKSNREGCFDLADFEDAIDRKTKLIALTHVSNVLGTITPIKEIAKIGRKHGSLLLVDGAQSVPHMEVDVRKIDCDFLAFSGHKMCGPTGIGILYLREDLLESVKPLCFGGGTVRDVGLDYYRLVKGPRKFEAGTPPIAEAIGLGAAIDYLQDVGINNVRKHEAVIIKKICDQLMDIPRVLMYGPEPKHRIGILSFNIEGLSPHDVALALDFTAKIMVRSGAHCALPLIKDVIQRPDGTVRVSTYLYNTYQEVDRLVDVISELSASLP
jgi:cysteine desulfurase/selenocysteine lyase